MAPCGSFTPRKLRWLLRTREPAFDQRLAVFREQHAIARLVDGGEQHGLRRVARDRERERARRRGLLAAIAIRDERRRGAAGDEIAQVGRIGRIETARLVRRHLAGAEHFDGDAAGLALGIRDLQQRHVDRGPTSAAGIRR